MKVLFLDIDGVLNSIQSNEMYNRRNKNTQKQEWNPYEEFCPITINNLVELLEAVPDLKIVISSTWRMGCDTVDKLKAIFDPIPESHGRLIIQNRIIDSTPVYRKGPRGDEIANWLSSCKTAIISKYAILDDDSDMLGSQMPNFFNTDAYLGLTWRDADKVINHFEGKRN